jgi:hypothetical protein
MGVPESSGEGASSQSDCRSDPGRIAAIASAQQKDIATAGRSPHLGILTSPEARGVLDVNWWRYSRPGRCPQCLTSWWRRSTMTRRPAIGRAAQVVQAARLLSTRLAEPYEALREAADAAASSGKRAGLLTISVAC